mgnify:CR=1 FL=1
MDTAKRKASKHAYYQVNRERWLTYSRANHQAHRNQERVQKRFYHDTLIAEALRRLGNKCACPGCEVAEPMFLTIDHIDGRPKGTRRTRLAANEAKASGWDKTKFQILCWNCNMSKRDLGFCPVHQNKPENKNGHKLGANSQITLFKG